MTPVAILGTGAMAMTLGRALARGRIEIILGSRDPGRIGAAPGPVVSVGDAIASAEIVILAVPYPSALALCPALADRLVIDPTTPWGDEIPDTSAAAQLRARLPRSATLVGAWKTTFALAIDAGKPGDVLLCGDDELANARVADLIRATGARALACGGLSEARLLEATCRALAALARRVGDTIPVVELIDA